MHFLSFAAPSPHFPSDAALAAAAAPEPVSPLQSSPLQGPGHTQPSVPGSRKQANGRSHDVQISQEQNKGNGARFHYLQSANLLHVLLVHITTTSSEHLELVDLVWLVASVGQKSLEVSLAALGSLHSTYALDLTGWACNGGNE